MNNDEAFADAHIMSTDIQSNMWDKNGQANHRKTLSKIKDKVLLNLEKLNLVNVITNLLYYKNVLNKKVFYENRTGHIFIQFLFS